MYSSYFLRPMDASVMKLLNQTQAGRVEYARDLNTFPSAQRRARSASPIGRSLKKGWSADLTTPSAPPACWLPAHPPLLCEEGNVLAPK